MPFLDVGEGGLSSTSIASFRLFPCSESSGASALDLAEKYGRLLLTLPTLRNFAPATVENLFFAG